MGMDASRTWVLVLLFGIGCGSSHTSAGEAVGGGDGGATRPADAAVGRDGALVEVPIDGGRDARATDGGASDAADPHGTSSAAALDGTYRTEGEWTFSGPIHGDRSIGDVLTELVFEQVAALSSVPSFLEEELVDELQSRAGDEVAGAIDGSPAAMELSDDPAYQTLTAATLTLQVNGEMDLRRGAGVADVAGEERIVEIGATVDGYTVTIPVAADAYAVFAPIVATRTEDRLDIEPRQFVLPTRELITSISEEVIGVDAVATLAETVASAIDCDAIVSEILGGSTSIRIEVAGVGVSISTSLVRDACADVRAGVRSLVVSLFVYDTPVEVGGPVLLRDLDGDYAIDRLSSEPGYGGVVLVGPRPAAPRVTVRFAGSR